MRYAKTRILASLIGMVLVIALGIGGTFAWFMIPANKQGIDIGITAIGLAVSTDVAGANTLIPVLAKTAGNKTSIDPTGDINDHTQYAFADIAAMNADDSVLKSELYLHNTTASDMTIKVKIVDRTSTKALNTVTRIMIVNTDGTQELLAPTLLNHAELLDIQGKQIYGGVSALASATNVKVKIYIWIDATVASVANSAGILHTDIQFLGNGV